jgi:hypothetical protein
MKASATRRFSLILISGFVAAAGIMSGCGGGDRMETGTQVEVTQDMLDEADASDAYFDSQKQGTTPK